MKEAQKRAAVADLENTRNQALSNLQAERNQAHPRRGLGSLQR